MGVGFDQYDLDDIVIVFDLVEFFFVFLFFLVVDFVVVLGEMVVQQVVSVGGMCFVYCVVQVEWCFGVVYQWEIFDEIFEGLFGYYVWLCVLVVWWYEWVLVDIDEGVGLDLLVVVVLVGVVIEYFGVVQVVVGVVGQVVGFYVGGQVVQEEYCQGDMEQV